MVSSSDRSSTMCGPWKLFRIALRTLFFGTLAWFLLALLWAFLPSPISELDGDSAVKYSTSVLRSGKTLTRVYDWKTKHYGRQGVSLDYKLDAENLTISIGGHAIPILNEKSASGWEEDITGALAERINVPARTGDTDGANLPWFPFSDSVLLFWWIHKETISFTLSLQWRAGSKDLRRLEIHSAAEPWGDPLLSIEIQDSDPSTIAVSVPAMPLSSSPSSTYPLRVAIIHVIAPTAVLVNNLIGNAIGVFMESVFTVVFFGFTIFCYVFVIFAIVFSFWRCFRGPSFEDTVRRIQGRLERLSQNERLRVFKIEILRENLELLVQNERFMALVNVCRNGWHPERSRAMAAEENAAADIERGLDVREEGDAGEKEEAQPVSNKK